MLDTIKKAILAALKAVPLTAEEVRAVIQSFQDEGILTPDQARKILEAILPKVEAPAAGEGIGGGIRKLADLLPLVSRREFRELVEKVRRIEERLGSAAQAPDEIQPAGEDSGKSG